MHLFTAHATFEFNKIYNLSIRSRCSFVDQLIDLLCF